MVEDVAVVDGLSGRSPRNGMRMRTVCPARALTVPFQPADTTAHVGAGDDLEGPWNRRVPSS